MRGMPTVDLRPSVDPDEVPQRKRGSSAVHSVVEVMREEEASIFVLIDARVTRAHEPTVAQDLSRPVQEERAATIAERAAAAIQIRPGW